MKWLRTKNSASVQRAFLWATVSGSFPFSFEENFSKINYKCILWFFLSKAVLGIKAGQISIRVIDKFDFNSDHISIQYFVVYVINVLSFCFIFLHQERIDCLLTQYQIANSRFRNLGTVPYVKINGSFDILMLSISFLPIVFSSELGFVEVACQSFLYWSEYTIIRPFIVILIDLGTRLRTLRWSSIKIYKNRIDAEKNLEKIVELFHVLCSTCQTVNDIYSFQLLVLLTMILVNSVINMYYAITYVTSSTSNDSGSMFIQMVALLVYYNILCLTIATVCKNTTQKVKDFNILLYQLMIKDNSNRLTNNRKLRVHIAMKRQVNFTAYGFFDLDYTLVHSMVAAATTYLIIFIQFNETTTPTTPTELPFFLTTPS
ncbi:Gustatory receptor 76 [Halyomorpha halys]|nr:Gustatory receptor 76 [Halyomorpha halys]